MATVRLREDVDGKGLPYETARNCKDTAAVYGAYQSDHPTDSKEVSTELIRYIFNEDAFEAFSANKPKFNYQVDKDWKLQSLEVDMVFTVEGSHSEYLAEPTVFKVITFDQYNEPVQSQTLNHLAPQESVRNFHIENNQNIGNISDF